MKKILVTGGAGFIGSAVAERLLEQGNTVSAVDSFSDYYSQDLKRSRAEKLKNTYGLDVIQVELSDEKAVKKLFQAQKPDLVIHLAAQPGVRLPLSENYKYVRDNLVGFSNVATQACLAGTNSVLYASSSSVYGNSLSQDLTEDLLDIHPISFYGATKLCNETLARSLSNSSDTKFRGLRFFTVYGPWGRPDMAYFRIIEAAINKRRFQLFGDGTKTRDFTYISDVVSSVLNLGNELIARNCKFSDVVNVGGGNPISMNKLIETIELKMNTKLILERGPDAIGDVSRTNACTKYLNSLIQVDRFVEVDEGIKDTIEWALSAGNINRLPDWTL